MRFAVIADIHSNLHALTEVLRDINDRQVQAIYCLGDIVGYGAFPNEVIAQLQKQNINTLQGNYDESVGEELFTCGCDFPDAKTARLGEISNSWSIDNTSDSNKTWLRGLPKDIRLTAHGRRVLMVHGSPRKNNEYLHRHLSEAELTDATVAAKFDILLCGHTHLPYHRVVGGRHFINPGSVGKPKHGNSNAMYGIVEITGESVTLSSIEVAYPYEKAGAAILDVGLPEHFALALKA